MDREKVLSLAVLLVAIVVRADVIPYPHHPADTQSTLCSLSVDGVPIFVHAYKDKHYAWFAFTGEVTVRISAKTALSSCYIYPQPYAIQAVKEGNGFSFKLDTPRKLVITLNRGFYINSPALVIFAEAPEVNPPMLGDADVRSILEYGADATGAVDATAQINQAIADASAQTNGIVFVPAGIYRSGPISMKSDATLYLAPGAFIISNGTSTTCPSEAWANNNSFVCFNGVSNAKIMGRGCIDLNGNRGGYRLTKCNQCSMEGVLLRNCRGWTVHPVNSDSLTFKNVKIMNHSLGTDPGVYSDDAFNIDVCRHVLLDDVFTFTFDDAFAINGMTKSTKYPIYDIVARNCVFMNSARMLFIKGGGDEGNYAYVKDVLLENCHQLNDMTGAGSSVFIWGLPSPVPQYSENISILNSSTLAPDCMNLVAYANYSIRNVSIDNYTDYSAVLDQFNKKGQFSIPDSTTRGTIENVSVKCWTIGAKTIMNATDLAKLGIAVDSSVTISFSGCDALKARSRQAKNQAFHDCFADPMRSIRLTVLRPDGRIIASGTFGSAADIDIRRMVKKVRGVVLLRLVNQHGSHAWKAAVTGK